MAGRDSGVDMKTETLEISRAIAHNFGFLLLELQGVGRKGSVHRSTVSPELKGQK